MKPILCRIANVASLGVNWIIDLVDSLFSRGKLMRRSIMFWLLLALTFILYLISVQPDITVEQLIKVYGITIAAFSGFSGFYIYLRNKDGD
jgi:TRAP-type uncharacterized transport system fused permease subunit